MWKLKIAMWKLQLAIWKLKMAMWKLQNEYFEGQKVKMAKCNFGPQIVQNGSPQFLCKFFMWP